VWYSRDRKHHYIQKQGPKQEALILAQKSVITTPLINPEKSLPLLRIKLELISSRQRIKTVLDLCI
jgi:hypothetical protein